ncbi:hypothetical protein DW099_15300 [Emergencia timonensis]|uniref:Uncharacterized protein n=1 Tax=Emergencia timonensis TaxID=1776384 RepID=A0A415DX69_9FIRM|nr:hypothetical protein DW099_15300 [Emergencia timonensis]
MAENIFACQQALICKQGRMEEPGWKNAHRNDCLKRGTVSGKFGNVYCAGTRRISQEMRLEA